MSTVRAVAQPIIQFDAAHDTVVIFPIWQPRDAGTWSDVEMLGSE